MLKITTVVFVETNLSAVLLKTLDLTEIILMDSVKGNNFQIYIVHLFFLQVRATYSILGEYL
jgi:hypothetical protein